MNKRNFGKIGEQIAKKYLIKKNYKILDTNYFASHCEIDIIAKSLDNIIVFVEVKTRSSLNYGYPSEAVNKTKLRHMKYVSNMYLKENKLYNFKIRFDVIEVLFKKRKMFYKSY